MLLVFFPRIQVDRHSSTTAAARRTARPNVQSRSRWGAIDGWQRSRRSSTIGRAATCTCRTCCSTIGASCYLTAGPTSIGPCRACCAFGGSCPSNTRCCASSRTSAYRPQTPSCYSTSATCVGSQAASSRNTSHSSVTRSSTLNPWKGPRQTTKTTLLG